jgi:hypothetical protein
MSNLYIVLWVIYQNHVCDLSAWVSLSSLIALSARLWFSLCLTAGGFRFLVPPLPARELGLPYGWLTVEARQTLSGLLCLAYPRYERGGCPLYCGEVWCPSRQEYRLSAFMKGNMVPSSFSQHHRLCYPHSDDQLITQPHQGFTLVHPSALHLARFSFVAKLPLRHYLRLRTLPLPGTHAEIGDRLWTLAWRSSQAPHS